MPTIGVSFDSGLASQGFVCVATNSDALLDLHGRPRCGRVDHPHDRVHGRSRPRRRRSRSRSRSTRTTTSSRPTRPTTRPSRTRSLNTAACNTCIDLVMGQIFADPNPVTDGGQTTYTFTVTNVGDLSTLTDPNPDDIEIRIDLDTIFDDSTFVSATATADFTCSQPFLLDMIAVHGHRLQQHHDRTRSGRGHGHHDQGRRGHRLDAVVRRLRRQRWTRTT